MMLSVTLRNVPDYRLSVWSLNIQHFTAMFTVCYQILIRELIYQLEM